MFLRKKVGEINQVPNLRIGSIKKSGNDKAFARENSESSINCTLDKIVEDDDEFSQVVGGASVFSGYITPGPKERATSSKKKANLGVMLGVYFPTIQHILGVTMFIRLFWIVGIAGIWYTMLLLFLCCFCTFLTSVSLAAVATNGVIESGGAYFMISRNLGAEFGSAVGLLFYLANTVATAMYLVGGIEILLLYIVPELTIGGKDAQIDTEFTGVMSNNLRLYGSILLLIEFVIVAMGVRFVQLLAPISLICVLASILACYAGCIEKTMYPDSGQRICMFEDHLIQAKSIMPEKVPIREICDYCTWENINANGTLRNAYNVSGSQAPRCVNGFPGLMSGVILNNLMPNYAGEKEYSFGKKANQIEVSQDVQTSFILLLAIYFPAVTGILTGTNMSGDLANPQRSIPKGTIAAQLTTTVIYFLLALSFGFTISPELLRDKYGQSLKGGMVTAFLAWPSKWILLIGSFLSTFGAALQCLCSAPRLLQCIAKDDVIPALKIFSRVTKHNEPFNGLLITTFIAWLAIMMGAMDSIAAIVDFFFLMCYAFVNLICALHSILGAPNWRPRFIYYHWSLSLLGAALCLFIMFFTHWDYAIISITLCYLIYKYVEWKGAKKEWGDGIRGLALTTAQYSLMQIPEKDPHPKNWRPQLLLLHSISWSKEVIDVRYLNLLRVASQLKAGKGLTISVSFLKGNLASDNDMQNAQKVKARMEEDMQAMRLRGFAKVLLYDDDQITGSVKSLIQSIGIGGLKPNTLLLNWPTKDINKIGRDGDSTEYRTFTDKLIAGAVSGMALVVVKGIVDFPYNVKLKGKLDVYWIVRDGGLCVLITFLLKQNRIWKNCCLRIIAVSSAKENSELLRTQLINYVYQLRIDAEILVTEISDPEISKSAFERTLLMEERTKILQEIHHNKQATVEIIDPNGVPVHIQESESDENVDENGVGDKLICSRINEAAQDEESTCCSSADVDHNEQITSTSNTSSDLFTSFSDSQKETRIKALDKRKVHKMHGALRLNELITEHSSESQLVVLSLPRPPIISQEIDDYIQYLEVISDKLLRVLFIRGTGGEVITTSS